MKVIKVRIAVVVDDAGDWNSVGWSGSASSSEQMSLAGEPMERQALAEYWVTAELPVPEAIEVVGQVDTTKS